MKRLFAGPAVLLCLLLAGCEAGGEIGFDEIVIEGLSREGATERVYFRMADEETVCAGARLAGQSARLALTFLRAEGDEAPPVDLPVRESRNPLFPDCLVVDVPIDPDLLARGGELVLEHTVLERTEELFRVRYPGPTPAAR